MDRAIIPVPLSLRVPGKLVVERAVMAMAMEVLG
jgi:hypothetical protein